MLIAIPRAFALKVVDEKVVLEKFDDFGLCMTRDYSGDFCREALLRWVDEHPADAFRAGKAVRRQMNAFGAVAFFNKALSAKQGDCGDEDVALATVSGLNLPGDGDTRTVSQSQNIAFKLCYDKLKSALVQEVSGSNANFLGNACKALREHKALTGLKAKLCASK